MWSSFWGVVRAILYSLTERTAEATELLQCALSDCSPDDPLAANAIRLHLAATWLHAGEPGQAAEALGVALSWMAEQQIDFLPCWWHPPTMTMLCTDALRQGIQASMAQRMLVRHLGALATAPVMTLMTADDLIVRRRAADVLELLQSEPLSMLGEELDPSLRTVLVDLLATHRLLPASLLDLASLLKTARSHNSPNPTLIAVFGLYVHGVSREEIAERLHLSASTVRNYINHIFKVFDLSYDPAQRAERCLQLQAQALAAGYIGGASLIP